MKHLLKLTTSLAAAATVAASLTFTPQQAQAQAADQFLGQITWFPYTFCPRGWAETDGRLLAISQYSALFSLLGTNYGGDGRTTFGLPDLSGRTAMGQGTGPGLSPAILGQKKGFEFTNLTAAQLPSHNHLLRGVNKNDQAGGGYADAAGPGGDTLATPDFNAPGNPNPDINIYSNLNPNTTMNTNSITFTGSNQSVPLQDPVLVLRPCIALTGIFPSRN
ncbi:MULTISPECIES: phage tail protein [Roseobacteraceae]|uniref:phage tail protein n=1 Tax=Roseobacteraceae TaxID=2854170 RepID=UPI001C448C0B|nr:MULTISPECIES: tail fiber protein [Roseobacteraceae]MBV7408928.1 tail fiber protein [Maritimibacter sp. DP1N21-5]MBY5934385.1 tail fiber protein [Tateyamaria omphalii]